MSWSDRVRAETRRATRLFEMDRERMERTEREPGMMLSSRGSQSGCSVPVDVRIRFTQTAWLRAGPALFGNGEVDGIRRDTDEYDT